MRYRPEEYRQLERSSSGQPHHNPKSLATRAGCGVISTSQTDLVKNRGSWLMQLDTPTLVLIAITLFAATVNGALGYGFSSLTVPVALLFYTNRVLNPALVLVEVVVNTSVLIINRQSIPHVWRRTLPILLGLVPGIVIGSFVLSLVHPAAIKLVTYVVVLPLILIQAAGFRRVIQSERAVG